MDFGDRLALSVFGGGTTEKMMLNLIALLDTAESGARQVTGIDSEVVLAVETAKRAMVQEFARLDALQYAQRDQQE